MTSALSRLQQLSGSSMFLMCDVRCVMCDVRCEMYDVRCTMKGPQHGHQFIGFKKIHKLNNLFRCRVPVLFEK